ADNARQTQQLVSELVDGKSRAAVALPDSTAAPEGESAELTATRTAHGDLELRGTIPAVPDADSETHLVLPVLIDGKHQWCLLDPGIPGLQVTPGEPFDLSRTIAEITLTDVRVPESTLLAGVTRERVRDLALTLACAEAAGVADECVRIASEHAKVREQFGRPIGQFQAVKHMCAEMLCRAELSAALAWDAARADG